MTKEEMYEIVKNGDWYEKMKLAKKPELPKDLIYKMAEDENREVRDEIGRRPNVPTDLIIRLCCDEGWSALAGLYRSFTKEELETAYDLIYNSKYVSKKNIKETFDHLSKEFPELSKYIIPMKIMLLKKV